MCVRLTRSPRTLRPIPRHFGSDRSVLIAECPRPVLCHVIVIKGSEVRKADHLIEKLLIDRWSPRAMSGAEISQEELMRLFEAARWAPTSFNAQQWRVLYAHRGTKHWQRFFDLLVAAN